MVARNLTFCAIIELLNGPKQYILNLLVGLGIAITTSKSPQVPSKLDVTIVQHAVEYRAQQPDFDRDVIIPLRKIQAAEAAKEAAEAAKRLEADIARTRDRVKPTGTYASTYSFGNCTYYVASRIQIPGSWGNANTWLADAQAQGWPTGAAPRVGAIATTTNGYYGHVAIVEAIQGPDVLISEMNYAGFNVVSTRLAAASEFNYIY